MKRLIDFGGALVGLVVLSPFLALLWLAVVAESGLPGLFRQRRMGLGGQDFVLFKFRTMTHKKTEHRTQKAESREGAGGRGQLPEVRSQTSDIQPPPSDSVPRTSALGSPTSESGAFDVGDTSRVTAVGRFLRKTKLDELPQLWNVLRGDMSLVGPRPEVRKWVEAYPERWAKVLTVRPGITDPASIAFRNEEELLTAAPDPENYYRNVILPRKLALYEQYVATRSFWGDVGILLKTVWTVVVR